MDPQNFSQSIIPEHGSYTMPTMDEVRAVTEQKQINEFNQNPVHIIAYGVFGSFMRNLDTPDSDRDITVIFHQEGVRRPGTAHADDDYAFTPFISLMPTPMTMDTKISQANLGMYEQMTAFRENGDDVNWNEDSPYAPAVRNIRLNPYYSYRNLIHANMYAFEKAQALVARGEGYERVLKFLKRSLVLIYSSENLLRMLDGKIPQREYTPRFSDETRERFYLELHEFRMMGAEHGAEAMLRSYHSRHGEYIMPGI